MNGQVFEVRARADFWIEAAENAARIFGLYQFADGFNSSCIGKRMILECQS